MAILITVGLFVVLLVTIVYAGYRFYARPGRVYEQLGGQAAFSMPQIDRLNESEPGLLVTIIEQIGEKLPINPADATSIRRDLIAAGHRSDKALTTYIGIRVLACAVLVIVALVFRSMLTSNPVLAVVIPVGAGVLGYFGPSFVLDYLIGSRQERIRWGLPDALDLLVVSVEAGLGLDQAIQHVARELVTVHPDVSDELELVNLEIRGGQRRADALRHLADRTGEPELRKLVAIMIQTDRFGTSIADALRTHSDFMRTRRRQEAEERANKVGVKLVFPIFFLILPSMLVVAAGPGLLQVFKTLIPMMKSFHGAGI
jgi:tight adherence protein C